MEKKQWQKPQLISLVRSDPQEAVLEGCKWSTLTGTPTTGFSGCCEPFLYEPGACVGCFDMSVS